MNSRRLLPVLAGGLVVVLLALALILTGGAQSGPPEVDRLRMYIFDLGFLPGSAVPADLLFPGGLEVAPGACCFIPGHLIVHPRGTLMWDAGMVPDTTIGASGPNVAHMSGGLSGLQPGRPLGEQLAEIGYTPDDITYLALSHWHPDHVANANAFRNSIWIAPKAQRDVMFAGDPVPGEEPATSDFFIELRSSRSIILSNIEEYDVFGDGTVILKAASGHTPGHQVLIVHLPETGPVMLGGDLYHFPEEREAQVVPITEHDQALAHQSRAKIEEYLQRHSMSLWIGHDSQLYATLEKSPAYIE